jgi:hypothetical protein
VGLSRTRPDLSVTGDSITPMRNFLWVMFLTGAVQAQRAPDATALLQKAKSFGENTRSWRAEAVQTSQVSLPGMKIPSSEIHIKLAAEAPFKMSRVNSGDDRTAMICDGTQQFYSGDGLSYYLNGAGGQCSFPLLSFYEPSLMNFIGPTSNPSSVTVIGEDHVRLADGERRCLIVRVVLVRESGAWCSHNVHRSYSTSHSARCCGFRERGKRLPIHQHHHHSQF